MTSNDTSDYPLAHLRPEGREGPHHSLEEHLTDVADLAKRFAQYIGTADWAYMAGLWHDLGKYNPGFQRYLQEVGGISPEDAHLESDSTSASPPVHKRGPDHSTAGAVHAIRRFAQDHPYGEIAGRVLAYMIAGHHGGLADWHERKALGSRLQQGEQHLQKALAGKPPASLLQAPLPDSFPAPGTCPALWIRMLFSTLVDADFLDTEAFMSPERAVLRGDYPSMELLNTRYHTYMETLQHQASDTSVNRHRRDILSQCLEGGALPPGLFSLTVPTGGGKTLAGLGFALAHALHHNKRRIIYVIPYTSIIEQTAAICRKVLGTDAVVEHHSQFDPASSGVETTRQRLACENWDAPVIITTNVQFFESLYAHQTSRVRKLHNIADSVVILDEAQMLKPSLLDPIRHVMRELINRYGVSMVLSTATQPVLSAPPQRPLREDPVPDMPAARELMAHPAELYRQLNRVSVHTSLELRSWECIAESLCQHEQVLCIVNRRQDCRDLHDLMPEGTIHLSALMCGAHRSDVIAQIKQRLQNGQPIRVISTQLVEAGVDIDFPVVYRAMAGLDAIAQAAGRCNREGALEANGQVHVFVPPTDPPRGMLSDAEQAGREVLRQLAPEKHPLDPDCMTRYFQCFYNRVARHDAGYDEGDILRDKLCPNRGFEFAFRSASEAFQLIQDGYRPVIVPYGNGAELIERLRAGYIGRDTLRQAQRFTVTLPERAHAELMQAEDIVELEQLPGTFVLNNAKAYEAEGAGRGLIPVEYAAAELIV